MSASAPACGVDLAALLAYLYDRADEPGDLDAPAAAALEDHFFDCRICAARLAELDWLRQAVAGSARRAELSLSATHAFLERAAAQGLTAREYRLRAGEVAACAAVPEDLVVVRLAVDGGDLTAFLVDAELHDLETDTVAALPSRDVLVDRERGEVILVFPGQLIRGLPRSRWTLRLHASGPRGPVDLGSFGMDHRRDADPV